MLEDYRSDRTTLERLRNEPLGPYLDSYLASLESVGYTESTVRGQVTVLSQLSRWLAQKELTVPSFNERSIAEFLTECNRRHNGDAATLRHLLDYLRREGIVARPTPECEESPLGRLLSRYCMYLRVERGLTSATVDNYRPFVSRFLVERFDQGPLKFRELEPSNISNFILRHAYRQSLGRAKLMVTALRSFLRFLLQYGEIEVDLAASVPSVAHWRLSTVPKYLTQEEVERVLAACDRDTSIGRRDYAVLLLLGRLGLRAGEVVALELDDIDWRSGELVVRGKGLCPDRLPLLHDVGSALAAYLRRDRPHSPTRRLFVRARAPRRGFANPSTVSTIVARAIERAGLCPPVKGAHLLRHSLATRMIRRGASMAEIGQVLRHRVPQTTEIYAKVDFDGLRAIAQPWPGEGGAP